jgi:hypothetical protein
MAGHTAVFVGNASDRLNGCIKMGAFPFPLFPLFPTAFPDFPLFPDFPSFLDFPFPPEEACWVKSSPRTPYWTAYLQATGAEVGLVAGNLFSFCNLCFFLSVLVPSVCANSSIVIACCCYGDHKGKKKR